MTWAVRCTSSRSTISIDDDGADEGEPHPEGDVEAGELLRLCGADDRGHALAPPTNSRLRPVTTTCTRGSRRSVCNACFGSPKRTTVPTVDAVRPRREAAAASRRCSAAAFVSCPRTVGRGLVIHDSGEGHRGGPVTEDGEGGAESGGAFVRAIAQREHVEAPGGIGRSGSAGWWRSALMAMGIAKGPRNRNGMAQAKTSWPWGGAGRGRRRRRWRARRRRRRSAGA